MVLRCNEILTKKCSREWINSSSSSSVCCISFERKGMIQSVRKIFPQFPSINTIFLNKLTRSLTHSLPSIFLPFRECNWKNKYHSTRSAFVTFMYFALRILVLFVFLLNSFNIPVVYWSLWSFLFVTFSPQFCGEVFHRCWVIQASPAEVGRQC